MPSQSSRYLAEAAHYFNDGIDGPDRYAAGYRTMFGRNVSSFDDIGAYIPRLVFGTVYLPDGSLRQLGINSNTDPKRYDGSNIRIGYVMTIGD